jgi:hypothetical protein
MSGQQTEMWSHMLTFCWMDSSFSCLINCSSSSR